MPAALPSGVGLEAVGVVEETGPGVAGLRRGQRVAYLHPVPGAYAEQRVVPLGSLVPVPRGIDDVDAAALLTKGLTAEFLVRRVHRVRRGETLLVQAAAGGVGRMLVQWARHLGARVIGIVGNAEKVPIAREAGCWQVLLAGDDWLSAVRQLTDGQGVDVVYDGVGAQTFGNSLDSLRPKGLMVSYGAASGPVPPISPMELARRGSLYLTRPMGPTYLADPGERDAAARAVFALVRRGVLTPLVGQTFALHEAADAHRALEARRTVGATVLRP
jgi:NADPH2:quinone reductase